MLNGEISYKSPTNHHMLASLGVRISSLFSGCQRQPPKLGRVGASVGDSEPRPRGPVIHRAMAEAMAQFTSMFYRIETGGFPYPMTDPWCWYINANMTGVY